MKNIEILAPAGSKECLEAAVGAGADAVYLGGARFGARAFAENFGEEELLFAIDYAHIHGKKLYLTVNTLVKDGELSLLYRFLAPLYREGLDAVIVQDLGAMDLIREEFPDLPIHVSTQATVTGRYGAAFFREKGAERIVPARELSLREVRRMKQETGLQIECFVHGALCYCYSGQCLLSSMIGGRSGNRGQCAQPCRLSFDAGDGKRQDMLSLKDLCTIDMIPELAGAGIDSFKIEGRMKQPDYVYTVVRMYRKYTDIYLSGEGTGFSVSERDREILLGSYRRRGYTKGYYYRHNGKDMVSLRRPKETAGGSAFVPCDKMQEKINGKLILSEGERAKLYIRTQDVKIVCEGDKVQRAKNQPLDAGRIEKQMRKTGNTEFVFDRLDIETEGEVFLPMQSLNELRRAGIDKLKQAVLSTFRRELGESKEEGACGTGATPCLTEYGQRAGTETKAVAERRQAVLPKACKEADAGSGRADKGKEKNKAPELSVLVSQEHHLKAVLGDRRIDTVYVDGKPGFAAAKQRRGKGQRLIFAMPYIFREGTAERWEALYEELVALFDGVLIRSLESYQWLKEHKYPKEIRTDYNIYVFNRRSKRVMEEMGNSRFFAPVVLICRELSMLGLSGGGLIVYGNQPVMVSANCVRKNTTECQKTDGQMYLTDRYQKRFAVKNYCADCYNVIYNCQPLMLLSRQEEVKRLHPAELRMDLMLETREEAERVIRLYWECFKKDLSVDMPDMDHTNGHFNRGVK